VLALGAVGIANTSAAALLLPTSLPVWDWEIATGRGTGLDDERAGAKASRTGSSVRLAPDATHLAAGRFGRVRGIRDRDDGHGAILAAMNGEAALCSWTGAWMRYRCPLLAYPLVARCASSERQGQFESARKRAAQHLLIAPAATEARPRTAKPAPIRLTQRAIMASTGRFGPRGNGSRNNERRGKSWLRDGALRCRTPRTGLKVCTVQGPEYEQ